MSEPPALIVLAAGQGTRMKSDLPKVLHGVAGRTMIGHVLAAARAVADRVVVVIGPNQDAVRDAVQPTPVCVQERPLGTGDAARVGLAALGRADGPVLVVCGDMPCVRPEVYRALLAALPAKGDGLAAMGFRAPGETSYGRFVMGEDGGLARIVEARDASDEERAITLCNSGLLAATSARLLARLVARLGTDNAKGEFYLTDAVALARADGVPCAAVEGEAEDLLGVNSRAELAMAEMVMQTRLRADAMAGGATLTDPSTVYFSFDTRLGRDVVVGPHVWFGPGVTVGDHVEIRSYCHIEGARVADAAILGPFARLRPGAEIGKGAHIGNFVEIKAARIGAGAKINHLSYVGDATVGAEANIGAGTITCNYDGFDKHVTAIGAGAFIGSDVALVAPVVVGDGAVIGAGSVITGDVPDDALAIARGAQQVIEGGGARYRARKSGAGDAPKKKAPKKTKAGAASSRKRAKKAAPRKAVRAKSPSRRGR